jgi:AcrR family transcriptional regulator
MRPRPSPKAGGTRLSPDAYFNAAFKILAEHGPEALTIDALCAHLKVTKGSFYHHFSNTAEFVAALMQCWDETSRQLMDALTDDPDPAHQLEAACRMLTGWPYDAETSIRAWGQSNPTVAATVRRQDLAWERANREFLARFIDDPQRCRVLAHMGVCMIAGMQQRERPLDRDLILAAVTEFMRTNLGLQIEIDNHDDGPRLRLLALPPRNP